MEALNALARVNTVAVDILRQVGVGPVLLRGGEGVAVVLFRGSLDAVVVQERRLRSGKVVLGGSIDDLVEFLNHGGGAGV